MYCFAEMTAPRWHLVTGGAVGLYRVIIKPLKESRQPSDVQNQ